MYFIKTYLKSQGHSEVKVKGTEYERRLICHITLYLPVQVVKHILLSRKITFCQTPSSRFDQSCNSCLTNHTVGKCHPGSEGKIFQTHFIQMPSSLDYNSENGLNLVNIVSVVQLDNLRVFMFIER